MKIKHKEVNSVDYYTFSANGTWYSVGVKQIQDGFKPVFVYSNRFKDTVVGASINCYDSLEQLAKRSKAMANFVKLIKA